MTPIRCEVTLYEQQLCERKMHCLPPPTLLLSFLFCNTHWQARRHICGHTCTRKRLAVPSLHCCLSDGMINEARRRTHSSGTREALVITGGISHTGSVNVSNIRMTPDQMYMIPAKHRTKHSWRF